MAALTTNVAPHTGLQLGVLGNATFPGGDTAVTGAGVFLLAQNTTGAAITVTVVTPGNIDGDLAVADRAVSVPATTGLAVIPLPDLYRDPATGRAAVTYSATGLKVAVVKVSTV